MYLKDIIQGGITMDNTNFLSQEEQRLFDVAKAEEEHVSSKDNGFTTQSSEEEFIRETRDKYQKNGIKLYTIIANLAEDDDTDIEVEFLFKKPSNGSYDRYLKTVSTSMSKASKAFVMDNIIEEQKAELKEMLVDYPALAISISGKFMSMLGMADSVSVKKA